MGRTIFLSLILSAGLFGGMLAAEEVSVSVSAPAEVAMGERFRVVFSVNARINSFSPPDFQSFRIISGPSQSSSSSTQIINGKVSTTYSVSYTYIIEALQEGKFQIPPASAVLDGNTFHSDPFQITVTGKRTDSAAASPSSPQQSPADTPDKPGENDLFIRAHVSNTNPFQSEQVIIYYKLYTRLPISAYSIEKLPSFQGFWSENITSPGQPDGTMEVIDGITYSVAEIRRVAVFPQRAGRLQVDPLEVECIVRMRSRQRSRSLFEDFFGGSPFDSFQNVRELIRSNAVVLDVKPFPTQNRPAAFNGMVGDYELSASLKPDTIRVNDAANLLLTVSGSGNMRMVEAPFIQFPVNLEVFDPNINDNISINRSGIGGERSFDYLMIPRTPGTYEIPMIKLVFLDPESGTYQTKTAGPFTIEAEAQHPDGSVMSAGGQEAVRMIGTDIRYIYTRPVAWTSKGDRFYLSRWFYLLLFIPAFLFSAWLWWWLRDRRLKGNVYVLRNRKAAKLADKRLKKARLLLKTNNREAFYNQISHALWGYVSDKFSLPMAEMNQESVKTALQLRQVSEELSDSLLNLLDHCAYARFAPGNQETQMEAVFLQAKNMIIRIEKEIRTTNHRNGKKRIIMLLVGFIFILCCGTVQAALPDDIFQEANKSYAGGAWAHAIELYEQLLNEGWEAPELYYNLGNAYFRENRLGPAVLNYERALKLAPADENILFNLDVAKSRITDRVDPLPLIFYERWMKQLLQLQTADNWARTALLLFALMFLFAALYINAGYSGLKKLFFGLAIAMMFCSLSAFYAAQKQYIRQYVRVEAVVFSPRITAKSAPDESSPDLFVIHEGTKVKLKQSIGEWTEIRLENGNQGWVRMKGLEEI